MNITLLLLLLFLHYYPAHTTLETFSQIELHLQESVVNSMKMLSMVYIRIFLLLGQRLVGIGFFRGKYLRPLVVALNH